MLRKFSNFEVSNKKILSPMPNHKGTNIFSEVGKFFKENDATSAMSAIMDMTNVLKLSEKRLFGCESRCNIIKFVTSRHVKCHYLGMIKMSRTKYTYQGKELTANQLVALFDHSKKGRKYSRNLGCYHITVDVTFAGRNVRLFFCKRGKWAKWNGLITTNRQLCFIDAYRIYSMRWSLEVYTRRVSRTSAWASTRCATSPRRLQ